jgi:hypothetical protein
MTVIQQIKQQQSTGESPAKAVNRMGSVIPLAKSTTLAMAATHASAEQTGHHSVLNRFA